MWRPMPTTIRVVGLALCYLVVSGGACGDVAAAPLSFDGGIYYPRAGAAIPESELTPIGTASGIEAFGLTDATVYAVDGADPSIAIALRAPGAPSGAAAEDPAWADWPFVVFASSTHEGRLDDSICRYFDARSPETPPECQAPVTIRFDGAEYRLLSALPGEPMYPMAFSFTTDDLHSVGQVDELDPRLAHSGGKDGASITDPTALAIDGIDPSIAVVLLGATGEGEPGAGEVHESWVFVSSSLALAPPALCPYLEANGKDTSGDASEAQPSDGAPLPDVPIRC